jgi:hypothetical protein
VSRTYWGTPTECKYYGYLFSFLAAIGISAAKNILFLPGSKTRMRLTGGQK